MKQIQIQFEKESIKLDQRNGAGMGKNQFNRARTYFFLFFFSCPSNNIWKIDEWNKNQHRRQTHTVPGKRNRIKCETKVIAKQSRA